jgi:hypothetical protein
MILIEVLAQFKGATNYLSGNQYPSSGSTIVILRQLVISCTKLLEDSLQLELRCVITELVKEMKFCYYALLTTYNHLALLSVNVDP